MRMDRLVRGLVSSLCVCAGAALLYGAPAQALEVHKLQSSFGSAGTAPGEFEGPAWMAVNDSTNTIAEPAAGDVYVVDRGNNRVERFSSTGLYLGQFNGSGTYEDVEEAVEVKTGAAAPTGAFSGPMEIAVDDSGSPLDPSAGDVYVVDDGHGVVDKFSPKGAYLGQLTGTPPCTAQNPCKSGGLFEAGEASPRSLEGVAVDPSGTLWVSTYKGPIYSFSDAPVNQYQSEREAEVGNAGEGLAVDSEDNLYINEGGGGAGVAKFNGAGEVLSRPFGGDTGAFGVAVDRVGGEVYLDNLTSVEAFSLGGAPIESGQSGSPFPAFASSGELTFSKGVAVNSSDGTVYVSDQPSGRVLVYEGVLLPSVSMGAVSEQQPRSVTLNGTVDPEGKAVGSCVFEYVAGSEYEAGAANPYVGGVRVPCEEPQGGLGEGTVARPVSAHLTGLTPGVTYHYRLVAENTGGKSPTPDRELFTGPVLGGEFATDVASSSATLQEPVDPNGGDTHYYFQYGPTAEYGSYAPVLPPGVDLGAASGVQNVSVHLQNLEAGTDYHYRFVAVQGGETFPEPDRTFRTQSAGGLSELADGRQWELVSPADSHGALIEPFQVGGQVQAANNGSGIAYMTRGVSAADDPVGKTSFAQVLSTRGSKGWETSDLTLPSRIPENGEGSNEISSYQPEYDLFSPDLSSAAVEPEEGGTPPLSPEATERTLYLRNDLNSSFLPLVTAGNVPEGARIEEPSFIGETAGSLEFEMHFLAATPDLGHVVFETPMALTPEATDEENIHKNISSHVQWNLYEWGGGQLQLVNILPGNAGVAHGPYPKEPEVRLAGMTSIGGQPHGGAQRDVSSDGRYVAWTWGETYSSQKLNAYKGLYVRDMVEERTMRVGGPAAIYQTMNSTGSEVFYLENGDLYMFDTETETPTDLTVDHVAGKTSAGVEISAGVQEDVSDVSENGSYVYFVAHGVLGREGATLSNVEGRVPVKGEDNLYVLHDTGEGWTTGYIATLSPSDVPSWYSTFSGVEVPYLAKLSSRVSPDGHYLTFMSERPLTGYDNTDAVSGQPDEEVFLYDAETSRLVCASCDPTGARPVGVYDTSIAELLVDRVGVWTEGESSSADQRSAHWLAGSIPGWDELGRNPATYQPRYLSDSGRLFFDSPDALVPQDINGLEDVYEYEPTGMGSCTEATASGTSVYAPAADGCVSLMSSGTSSSESAFYDASENGDDVFFTTTSRLVSEDYDNGYDVYDAHVCGAEGVPCKPAPVAAPPCVEGESCKAAPSPQPEIYGPPPTATFNGVGNLTPTSATPVSTKTTTKKAVKCAKGKTRNKRGVCVKQKSKQRKTKKSAHESTKARH